MRGKEGGPFARAWKKATYRTARPGEDPAIEKTDKGFLLVQSHNTHQVTVTEVPDLRDIASKANKEIVLWTPGKRDVYQHGVWAPEMHRFPNTPWEGNYIYTSATPDRNAGHRRIVLKSEGSDARSRYHLERVLIDPDHDNWAIDMTVIQPNPERPTEIFAVWSEDEYPGDEEKSRQRLFIQPMSDPTTLTGRRMLLAEPTHKWEANINEGPQALHYPDGTFVGIHYAGGPSWTSRYGVGVILYNGGDPMKPSSWDKQPVPLYVGGGHAAIGLQQGGEYLWARGEKIHTEGVLDDGWDDRGIVVGPHEWDRESRLPILQPNPIVLLVTFSDSDREEYAGDLVAASGF